MKTQFTGSIPLAILFGKVNQFTEALPENFIYDPISQRTETVWFGNTGTGGQIGTKSLKTVSTGTGGKHGSGRSDYNSDSKNEIDDSKYKDK